MRSNELSMQNDDSKHTAHQTSVTFVCPSLLPAIQDGDIDALLDALLSVAKRLLQQQRIQSMVESDPDQQAA
jgi:hypothetical protein